MEFKDRIKELRKERKMTQSQLGTIVSLSEGAIRAWEDGRTKPDLGILIKLAVYFGVTSDYLLGMSDLRHRYEHEEKVLMDRLLEEKYKSYISTRLNTLEEIKRYIDEKIRTIEDEE